MKTLFLIAATCVALQAPAQKTYTVRSGETEITVSPNGEVTGIRKRGSPWIRNLTGRIAVRGDELNMTVHLSRGCAFLVIAR